MITKTFLSKRYGKTAYMNESALVHRLEELVKENEILKYKLVMMDKALEEQTRPDNEVSVVRGLTKRLSVAQDISPAQMYINGKDYLIQLRYEMAKALVSEIGTGYVGCTMRNDPANVLGTKAEMFITLVKTERAHGWR